MSQSKIIIFVADNNYIDHVKSIAVNCRVHGNYKGEFAVVCPTNSEAAAEFKKYGFHVLERGGKTFFQKFYVFDEYFKAWEQCLYLDCDIIIQDDLQKIFDLLKIDKTKIWMDTEDSTTMLSFWRDTKQAEHKPIYDMMREKYPHVENQSFNSALMLFNPKYIPENAPEKLIEIQKEIEPVNSAIEGGTDQQILNILLWHQMKKIERKLICFWGLAEPQNDVDSEYRMYKKGDVPVVIHYCRWHAMWLKKTPDADAYMNRKLDIPCYELYHQNLEKFTHEFR